MLPLWIIDITNKSDRRDAFVHLIGQIDHVLIPKQKRTARTEAENGEYHNIVEDIVNETEQYFLEDTESTAPSIFSDNVDNEEERKAARNARIEGDYWYYNSYELSEYFSSKDFDDSNEISDIAGNLYKFQEALVRDAKKFIMNLRSSNAKPYQPINIVVLGDASEKLTQTVFASIAAILQKEKGRFLTGHIHQGMNILGVLYIPCDINSANVEERVKVLRLLKEIEVQHNTTAIRGYDNMMLYQDVQNRTECTYKRLAPEEQAQYLVQCLVHMFLACDINHPLLNGTGSDDTFYLSMGASSIYFDMSVEDKNDANTVASNILNTFKSEGDHELTNINIKLFDESLYTSDKFVEKFNIGRIDLEQTIEKKSPSPHPIADYMHRNLKRLYYQYYLRYFPADLLRETMQKIEDSTNKELELISINCSSAFKDTETTLPPAIKAILSKVNKNCGGLSFVEDKFKDMQEFMSKEKANIQRSIESKFWQKVIDRNNTSLEDYHDAYVNDIKVKNSGAGCNMMKQEILKKLKELLSKEKTFMGTIIRSFLLGIIFVLSLLPIVQFMSETVIDLGDVKANAFYWGTAFFMIPLVIQVILLFLYARRKNNLIRTLKTYYTHDAYARIANRIESEAVSFYNKILELIDAYLERCKIIRNEIVIETPDPHLKLLFPTSMFNQPLNGGEFDKEPLIPVSEIEGCYIRVNNTPVLVNNLTQEQIFILINHFRDEISELFQGVKLIENHARRLDEKTGEYEFISRKTLVDENDKRWQETKQKFNTALFLGIKKEMLPRAYPTIGDKLIQYSNKMGRIDLLEHMIAYAATNGELSSHSDTEYADIKINRNVENLMMQYLPYYTTSIQCSQYDETFKRYIFVTRWRTFSSLALNRILPKEDFDQATREERVYTDEEIAKQRKRNDEKKLKGEKVEEIKKEETAYSRTLSSLILWAVSPDDNSNEWLKLFEVEHFGTAYKERNEFRKILNQND